MVFFFVCFSSSGGWLIICLAYAYHTANVAAVAVTAPAADVGVASISLFVLHAPLASSPMRCTTRIPGARLRYNFWMFRRRLEAFAARQLLLPCHVLDMACRDDNGSMSFRFVIVIVSTKQASKAHQAVVVAVVCAFCWGFRTCDNTGFAVDGVQVAGEEHPSLRPGVYV